MVSKYVRAVNLLRGNGHIADPHADVIFTPGAYISIHFPKSEKIAAWSAAEEAPTYAYIYYTFIYVCMYVYTCIYSYIHINMNIHIYIHVYIPTVIAEGAKAGVCKQESQSLLPAAVTTMIPTLLNSWLVFRVRV
jgi:hypothetical protein